MVWLLSPEVTPFVVLLLAIEVRNVMALMRRHFDVIDNGACSHSLQADALNARPVGMVAVSDSCIILSNLLRPRIQVTNLIIFNFY